MPPTAEEPELPLPVPKVELLPEVLPLLAVPLGVPTEPPLVPVLRLAVFPKAELRELEPLEAGPRLVPVGPKPEVLRLVELLLVLVLPKLAVLQQAELLRQAELQSPVDLDRLLCRECCR